MEIDKSDVPTVQLPNYTKNSYISTLIHEIQTEQNLSPLDLFIKIELILRERAECTCGNESTLQKCKCGSLKNKFILGQFYYDYAKYKHSYNVFNMIKHINYEALYQVAVILYDDLLDLDEPEGEIRSDPKASDIVHETLPTYYNKGEVDTRTAKHHPNKKYWEDAVKYMMKIAESPNAKALKYHAQYSVGKAYFQGFGVLQSDEETEKWWLAAADNGNPKACVTAMTMLAFFYSRKLERQFFDLEKVFFWHNEACGNGSLESQGALGAIYYYGIGRKRDLDAAYECLTESAERGNVYAMGLLCHYYYTNKFFVKAAELSKKMAALNDIGKISHETLCIKGFIAKGLSIASFILARCLQLGKGIRADISAAQYYYKRSFYFDSDECQIMQDAVTHQKL